MLCRMNHDRNDSKVSLAYCAEYSDDMTGILRELLEPLGGINRFSRQNQSVLIKPNLLSDRSPDQAVTTNPELVRAVIRLVKESGGIPSVGDSPASVMKLSRVWESSGIAAVCKDENVPLVSFEKDGAEAVQHNGISFPLARPVLNADMIINLPKVKTHVLTTLTAGVKNMYGAVPGLAKTILHRNYPDPRGFGSLIAAVYQKSAPALTIADGISAMHGDGPSGGKPFSLGLLAAAENAAALDLVLCCILKINPAHVPYLKPLQLNASAPQSLNDIELCGTDPARFNVNDFKVPATGWTRLIPAFLSRWAKPLLWYRPVFNNNCIACGRCIKACPAEALEPEKKTGRPLLLKTRCIGCCCCHECCPAKAISMQPSPLVGFLRGNKRP